MNTPRPIMLFCAIYALFILHYVTSAGTYFQEDETFGGWKEGSTLSNLFHKTFHQCGIDDNCRYLVQNRKTRKFTKISKKEDLPHAKKDFNVWYRKDVRGKLAKHFNLYERFSDEEFSVHYFLAYFPALR